MTPPKDMGTVVVHKCAYESMYSRPGLTKTLRSLDHSVLSKIMPCCSYLFSSVNSSRSLEWPAQICVSVF